MREPCKCDVYSRVVGYHRPTNAWNKGKKEEFADRTPFVVASAIQANQQKSISSFGDAPVKMLLFTAKTCPNCGAAKEFAEKQAKMQFTVVDASNEEGYELAKQHAISSVPTAVFVDDTNAVIAKRAGIDDIQSYVESI
jgi:ribonucleoside-triphosphate reductase